MVENSLRSIRRIKTDNRLKNYEAGVPNQLHVAKARERTLCVLASQRNATACFYEAKLKIFLVEQKAFQRFSNQHETRCGAIVMHSPKFVLCVNIGLVLAQQKDDVTSAAESSDV